MPGFTKTQLVEKALDPEQYSWCKHCRLYWSKRSFAKHRRSIQSGDIVKIDVPPMPRPKKGDVLVKIHRCVGGPRREGLVGTPAGKSGCSEDQVEAKQKRCTSF